MQSHEFLTDWSVIEGNCIDSLTAKFLFKELQAKSVKIFEISIFTTTFICSAVPCGWQQAPRQEDDYTLHSLTELHLQPELGERLSPTDSSVTVLQRELLAGVCVRRTSHCFLERKEFGENFWVNSCHINLTFKTQRFIQKRYREGERENLFQSFLV